MQHPPPSPPVILEPEGGIDGLPLVIAALADMIRDHLTRQAEHETVVQSLPTAPEQAA